MTITTSTPAGVHNVTISAWSVDGVVQALAGTAEQLRHDLLVTADTGVSVPTSADLLRAALTWHIGGASEHDDASGVDGGAEG